MGRKALKELADKLYPKATRLEESVKQEITLPVETMFLNALNLTIEKISNQPNRSSKSYKPSNLKCMRAMYYGVVGMGIGEILEEVPYNITGISESGTDRHERLQDYITKMKDIGFNWEFISVPEYIEMFKLNHLKIKKNKYVSKYETNLINTLYNMSFMTDGIIKFNDQYFILEIKTETSNKFYKRNGVAEDHEAQATAYSLSFGIDNVIFVYENRDTCVKKSYLFNVSDKMRKDLISKLQKCNEYVETKTLPPKTSDKKDCTYCKYKGFCKFDKNI